MKFAREAKMRRCRDNLQIYGTFGDKRNSYICRAKDLLCKPYRICLVLALSALYPHGRVQLSF